MIVGDIMRLTGNFTELTEQDAERIAGGFFFKFKKFRRCFRIPKRPLPPRPPNGPPGKEEASLSLNSFSDPYDYSSVDFFDSDFE